VNDHFSDPEELVLEEKKFLMEFEEVLPWD